jgi:ABC-type branched-subunit amino acid transport system substrate-binding protein
MGDRLHKVGLVLAPAIWIASSLAVVPAQAQEDIRIGVSLRMLTENGQKYGQMVQDEFEKVNAAGGINGHMIKVFLLDDQCKPDVGVANVNRFIN